MSHKNSPHMEQFPALIRLDKMTHMALKKMTHMEQMFFSPQKTDRG
ncbi:MAG TPA: hypothetical protein PLI57_08655 [Spirochaetota bacterium]|nr:hypothetical protein [Spirochaetota bacterium]